ncbi:efflux RND transporter periplasmic adaptor subunit [Gluconacetobacter takamatsuzukensis]|uniref:HlyD family secretion protein n=1 Tax=Gluconacetobacter takamatsuzukensis TaxID=1286190 RepID=A0A7W4PQF4_9PROT|nr:efflux RND transporter periplasmic adaptor subunit [Gluconacetobacter takamatsuzukensis]MBB2206303.1 HlyD family secretion protein [Gluconacetobacter takamatsuzukensis]
MSQVPPRDIAGRDVRQADLLLFSGILELCERIRTCPRDELDFVLVNETRELIPYQQAALYAQATHAVTAVSGVAVFERSAPYVRWIGSVFAAVARQESGVRDGSAAAPVRALTAADLPEEIGAAWGSWLGGHALLVQLGSRHGPLGKWLLARAEPWTAREARLLALVGGAYAEARQLADLPHRPPARHRARRWVLAGAALVAAVALYPVRSWVLAPAEVVAADPAYIRAPFAGIVRQIDAPPNGPVQAGAVVVELERAQLESQYQVASKAWQVARTEYDEAAQAGMSDQKARAQAEQLRGRIDEEAAQMRYQDELLRKASIPAPMSGLALYNDPSEWIGRPVEAGERILMVAPALSRRIEIRLPVTEIGHFDPGSTVRFFDNVRPDRPNEGHLVFASYGSSATTAGILAYTLRADMRADMRLGLKGTARIYGPRHVLILWALRKPLSIVRQWLSF